MSDESNIDDLIAQTSALIREAYARGFAAGGSAMRDNILKAASAPIEPSHHRLKLEPGSYSVTGFSTPKRRAPRGNVRALVNRILGTSPGLSTGKLGETAATIDNRVSPSSVSNELRRYEGVRYKKEGRG